MAYLEREHPSGDRRSEDGFTLFVNNLPVELTKDGVTQIFKAFGEIRSLIAPLNARWAFVSYKTYREAEHAIRALNDRGPLFLKVAFQKKKSQEKQPYGTVMAGPPQENLVKDFRYAETGVVPNVNYRGLMPGMIGAQLAHCTSYNHDSDVNSVYPSDLDHNIYNPFESVGRYAETNAMWSRGCVNVDDYGKRYVSMGRGFTRYHVPEPHPNLERQIGRVYEKRLAGLYEYGDDRLQSKVGKCQLCTRVTTLHCEKCAGFYCSRDCQITDWGRHMMECKTIPDLVGGLELATQSPCSSDDQLHVPRKPGGMDLREFGVLRRPKVLGNKTTNHETLEKDINVKLAAVDLNSAPVNGEILRENVTNEKSAQKNLSHQIPDQNTLQNFEYNEGMKGNSNDCINRNQNQRYDENSNDRYKSNARQQGGFINEQSYFGNGEKSANKENHLPFNKEGNFNSVREISNVNGKSKEVPFKSAQSEGISAQAKTNLMKMEEELAFQRDPRVQANTEKQIPFAIPTVKRSENVIKAKPIQNPISDKDFTDVVVVYSMPDGTVWVHRERDVSVFEGMMKELQTKTQCYPAAKELIIGEMYAVKYEDIWHRATLVSKKPPSIFYVDFGNEEPPQSDDFRLLTDFPHHPPYAIRVRLSDDTKAKNVIEQTKLSVKMTSVDKAGVVEVVDKEEVPTVPLKVFKTPSAVNSAPIAKVGAPKVDTSAPSTSKVVEVPTPSTSKVVEAVTAPREPTTLNKVAFKLPSSIDSLEPNDTGFIEVNVALNNNSYAVCVLNRAYTNEYGMIYESLVEVCNEAVEPTNYKPEIGDFVCGKRDDIWLRGYVFSLGPPIRLALVDEARISPVVKVLPMPAEYKNMCSFGSICTFQTPGSVFAVEEPAEFTVTGVETVAGERIVKAVLLNPDHLKGVGITLKNWSPTPEQKGIAFAELKSKSEVCITAYSSERVMFVRSLDEESQERSRRITQNVAKWAQKAPMLDGPPTIGQLVIAKFTDGNFYRAIVTKLQDEKIGVSYVDYGNRDITTIEELRVLCDELKQERSCAAKIVLKDIKTDVPPTQEVHQYLNLLVGKEQSLFCTFEGIPSKDGVILTTATGECVNLKVNEHLTPAWQREDPAKDTKCFTMLDIEYAKLGEVGETNKALVLFGGDAPFEYYMCPFDPEHLTHITEIMPNMINEYCDSTKEHYIPRIAELCLAPYEGSWYRGLCINPSATPTQAQIQFIDFGNMEIVNHTNIRQITKDFMSPAALACICYVQNPGIELINGQVPENIKTILDTEIPLNNIVDVKILEKIEDGVFKVEVPKLHQKLVEEGLLK